MVVAEAFCSSMMLVMKRTVLLLLLLLLLASLAMLPVLVPVSKMPFHNRPMGMKIQVSSTERLRQNLTHKDGLLTKFCAASNSKILF
jgi:hypothetical protein